MPAELAGVAVVRFEVVVRRVAPLSLAKPHTKAKVSVPRAGCIVYVGKSIGVCECLVQNCGASSGGTDYENWLEGSTPPTSECEVFPLRDNYLAEF